MAAPSTEGAAIRIRQAPSTMPVASERLARGVTRTEMTAPPGWLAQTADGPHSRLVIEAKSGGGLSKLAERGGDVAHRLGGANGAAER